MFSIWRRFPTGALPLSSFYSSNTKAIADDFFEVPAVVPVAITIPKISITLANKIFSPLVGAAPISAKSTLSLGYKTSYGVVGVNLDSSKSNNQITPYPLLVSSGKSIALGKGGVGVVSYQIPVQVGFSPSANKANLFASTKFLNVSAGSGISIGVKNITLNSYSFSSKLGISTSLIKSQLNAEYKPVNLTISFNCNVASSSIPINATSFENELGASVALNCNNLQEESKQLEYYTVLRTFTINRVRVFNIKTKRR